MKRFLSLLLTAAMLLAIVPVAAFSVSAATAFTYRTGANSVSSSYAGSQYYKNLQKLTLTGDGVTDVLAVALSQLGYHEGASTSDMAGDSSSANNYTEYNYNMGKSLIGAYGGSSYPWCASFMSWCLYQSGCTDQGSESDLCRNHVGDSNYIWREIGCSAWISNLKSAGYFKYSANAGGSYTPKAGDLIFFRSGAHIGMVLYVSGSYVYTIEGNTSDASGVEPEGGGVYFKSYALSSSSIDGYGALPYATNASVPKVDYSGANPSAGLWICNAYKYLYADAACTTRATYTDGVYVDLPRFTMFEATGVADNGTALIVNYDGVDGYISLNATDRVLQVTASGSSTNRETDGNIVYGKTPVISGEGTGYNQGGTSYNADLTDAYVSDSFNWVDDEWFGFYSGGSDGSSASWLNVIYGDDGSPYGTATFDLGGAYNLTKLGVHYYTEGSDAGIKPPTYIKAYASTDGSTYTEIPATFTINTDSTTEWSEVSVSDVQANYIKFEIGVGAAYAMLDEIEVFGTAVSSGTTDSGSTDTATTTDGTSLTAVFNPSSSDSGTNAIIYTSTDGANRYWSRVSFQPVEGNIYKVISTSFLTSTTTTTALTVPTNGFVLAIHDTCTNTDLLSFVKTLSSGQYVEVTGLSLSSATLASDATIKVVDYTESGSSSGSTSGGTISEYVPNDVVTNPEYILGIDISEWQAGLVDFDVLKSSGVNFVILRVHNGSRYDNSFTTFYSEARAAGLNLGVYMYTYATTTTEAVEEATMLIDYFDANGMYFEYPIYYDLEESTQNALSDANKVALCYAWCDTLAAAGYYPGIYTGLYTLVPALEAAGFMNDYDLWVPAYKSTDASADQYTYNTIAYNERGFKMWQYSCINKYNGEYVYDGIYTTSAHTTINANLDLDVAYTDYAALITHYGYNNCEATGVVTPDRETEGNLVYGKDYTVSGAGTGYTGGDVSYNADLTDAYIAEDITWADDEWFGFYNGGGDLTASGVNVTQNSENYYVGTITFDLGSAYSIEKIGVHYYNVATAGIAAPQYIKAYTSFDGVNYFEVSSSFTLDSTDTVAWTEISLTDEAGQYVKLEFALGSAFAMIDEIEVFGSEYTGYVPNREITGNILYGKDPAISGSGKGYGNYNADLTDGYVSDDFTWAVDEWFSICFADGNLETEGVNVLMDADGKYYGEFTFDLEGAYTLSKIGVHYYASDVQSGAGISIPRYIKAYYSTDGVNFREIDVSFTISQDATTVWAEVDVSDVIATHLRLEIGCITCHTMIDEIEAFGTAYSGTVPAMPTTGDLNLDGTLGVADYLLLKQYCMGAATLTEEQIEFADINKDGKIGVVDYLLLRRAILGSYTIG